MENGLMFTAARHTSQGRQQSYTPKFEEPEAEPVSTTLRRGYTLGGRPALDLATTTTKITKDDLMYQLSQNDISPYSSIGQVKLMRDVSYTQQEDLKEP